MSNPLTTQISRRFYLTLHRYLSASKSAPSRIPHRSIGNPITPLSRLTFRHASTAPTSPPFATPSQPTPSPPPQPTPAPPPNPATHYSLFPSTLPQGPPPTGPFTIPLPQLHREYLQLQSRAHPDLHRGTNRARAEGTSALINEAYKTLQDPLRRAQYLLSLHGIDVASDEHLRSVDMELLGDVMEIREQIEGVEREEELGELKVENEGREEECVRALGGCFERGDLEGAVRECVRLRYWVNVRESLEGWEGGKAGAIVH